MLKNFLSIEKCPIPAGTMLEKFTSINGSYVDAFTTEIPRHVSFPEYILAFYTTPLFKLERLILSLIGLPSTDIEARQLSERATKKFAAWTMETRSDDEIIMCDVAQRTRSWLMVKHEGAKTKLYFGTAVVPKAERSSLEFSFRSLMGFHRMYSVLLLLSAKVKLGRKG